MSDTFVTVDESTITVSVTDDTPVVTVTDVGTSLVTVIDTQVDVNVSADDTPNVMVWESSGGGIGATWLEPSPTDIARMRHALTGVIELDQLSPAMKIEWLYNRNQLINDLSGYTLLVTNAALDHTRIDRLVEDVDALEYHAGLIDRALGLDLVNLQGITNGLIGRVAAHDGLLGDYSSSITQNAQTIALHIDRIRDLGLSIEDAHSSFEMTADAINLRVSNLSTSVSNRFEYNESQIGINANAISLSVQREALVAGRISATEASIELTADDITLAVSRIDEIDDDIIEMNSTLVQSAESMIALVQEIHRVDGKIVSNVAASQYMFSNRWGVRITEDSFGHSYATGFGLVLNPDWVLGMVYVVNDTVWYEEAVYKSLIEHTATELNTPTLAPGYWKIQPDALKTEFAIQADRFYLRSPSGNNVSPFIVEGDEIQINGSLVINAPDEVTPITALDLLTATVDFNKSNNRNTTAIVAPVVATDGTAIDHATRLDGSVDISFEWTWAGNEKDIDGFIVYAYASSNATTYTFGSNASLEVIFTLTASKRVFFGFGLAANNYYTLGVRAYRRVDTSVDATGYILSPLAIATRLEENPYQPSTTVSFSGNVIGTIDGVGVNEVVQNAIDAAQDAADALDYASSVRQAILDVADDSKLTPGEKRNIKTGWDTIVGEKPKIVASAIVYGLNSDAYTTAYNTLNTYITPYLADLTTTSGIVRTTCITTLQSYFDIKQDLLKAISTAAGTKANWDGITGVGKPESGATVGAIWGTNLSGIPTILGAPSGSGLYLDNAKFGYYSSGAWKTYMDNTGNFYLGGTSGALQWNAGTDTLTIRGNIDIGSSGYVNLSDKPTSLADISATDAANLAAAAAIVAGIVDDNIFCSTEKKAQQTNLNAAIQQYADLVAQASALSVSSTAFTSAYNTVYAYMTPFMLDTEIDSAIDRAVFIATWNTYFLERQKITNAIAAKAATTSTWELTVNKPTTLAGLDATAATNLGTAVTDAANATQYASDAMASVNDIASDSKLTPVEKKAIRNEWDSLYAERTRINTQAAAFSITTEVTNYTTYMTAVGTVLHGSAYALSSTQPYMITDARLGVTDNIVGADFRSACKNMYDYRQVLLNKIADVAATKSTWTGTAGRPAESAIYNSNISISSAGVLSGAGGGSVTLSGIGYYGATNADKTSTAITSVDLGAQINISGSTLSGGRITANTITATQISSSYVYAGTIAAGKITAGTVTAEINIISSGHVVANGAGKAWSLTVGGALGSYNCSVLGNSSSSYLGCGVGGQCSSGAGIIGNGTYGVAGSGTSIGVYAYSTSTALYANSGSSSGIAIQLNGMLDFNQTVTSNTGSVTPTFTGYFPGSVASVKWLKIKSGGSYYWIPVWQN